jgi:ferredoxin-NADP reductase
MAMLRHRTATGSRIPTRLLYSSRTPEDIIYRAELEQVAAAGTGLDVIHTLTRVQPAGWTGYARRIDAPMLREVAAPLGAAVQAFICGPTLFVEAAASGLVQLGIAPERIRTERFGPTGGTS